MLFFLYEATKLPLSRIDLSILLHCSMAMVIIKDYSSNKRSILKKSQKSRGSRYTSFFGVILAHFSSSLAKKKRKFVSIKKIPTKNQEFCEYENENWIFTPKFAFGLAFERKDSFTTH